MKRLEKRTFSAFLLLAIALAVSVGLVRMLTGGVSSAPSGETPCVWVRLRLYADASVEEIRLYGQDGKPVQTLETNNGTAVSGLLTPGVYFAASAQGCTEFTLQENASVRVTGGSGRADGAELWLTDGQLGAVTVERLADAAALSEDGGWMDYTLVSETTHLREVVRCSGDKEVLTCTFRAVPYGQYVLEENGVAQCRVTVDADTPEIAVSLP
ncbi:MAG: hypothetical protein IJG45_08550 [Oscillospiraceae bacterium]|nr:hypothetical protein [Oscillospiraceae bacterium]